MQYKQKNKNMRAFTWKVSYFVCRKMIVFNAKNGN